MNVYYAKTVLYAYKSLEAVMEQIDDLVERRALSSMTDFSPCEAQCEKILSFTHQKDVLIELKIIVKSVLNKFSEEELDYFDYKYFKLKPKEYYANFDFYSRAYFRKQIKLAEKFAKRIEIEGIDDRWFTSNCMKMDFFRELYKRVLEHEEVSNKNKKKPPVKERANLRKTA